MTEIEKLIVLREDLVMRRHLLVDSFREAITEDERPDSIARIRSTIAALNSAIGALTYAESMIRRDAMMY